MPTAILVLLLFQGGIAHPISPPRVPKSQMNAPATDVPDFLEEPPPDEACEERELMRRLNVLAKALNAFTATYENGQVDLNEVKAVQKALHELEKSKLFRRQKAK